jgi:hypothetical protein
MLAGFVLSSSILRYIRQGCQRLTRRLPRLPRSLRQRGSLHGRSPLSRRRCYEARDMPRAFALDPRLKSIERRVIAVNCHVVLVLTIAARSVSWKLGRWLLPFRGSCRPDCYRQAATLCRICVRHSLGNSVKVAIVGPAISMPVLEETSNGAISHYKKCRIGNIGDTDGW